MKTNFDGVRADLTKLNNLGVALMNAMNVEQFPDSMEAHFKDVLKKDFQAFKASLPVFSKAYQGWYSEAQAVIKFLLPDRLVDFVRLYEQPKNRKEIKPDSYAIEDYLKDIIITTGHDKRVVVGPDAAIPLFQQQLNILNATAVRFESSLFDIRQIVQAELFDAELETARKLVKNNYHRSAAAICGVILEKHLAEVLVRHNLKIGKKNSAINDYNDLLKKEEIYDFQVWRYVQALAHTLGLCHSKKGAPKIEEVNDLLEGTAKVIKTIF